MRVDTWIVETIVVKMNGALKTKGKTDKEK